MESPSSIESSELQQISDRQITPAGRGKRGQVSSNRSLLHTPQRPLRRLTMMEQPPASPQAARDLLRHDNGTPPAVNPLSFLRGPLPSTTSQWNHQLPADVRRTGTAPNQGTARAGRARTSSVAGLAGSLMQSAKDHPHNSEGWLLDTIFHQCVKPRSPACDAHDARGADRSCTVVATESCRTTRK